MSESTERVEIQYVLSGLQEFLRGNEAAKGVFGEVIDYLKQAVGELKTISTNIASAMNAIPAAVEAAGQKTTAEIKAMSQANAKIAVEAAKAEAEIIKSKAKASGKVEEIAAKSAANIKEIEARKNAALEIEQVRSDNKRVNKAKDTAGALEKEAKKQARKEYDLLFDRTIDASSALAKRLEKDQKTAMRIIANEMKDAEIAKYSGLRNIGTAIAEVARMTQQAAIDKTAAWNRLRAGVLGSAGAITNAIFNIRNAIVVTFAASVIKKVTSFGEEFQHGLAEINTILDKSTVSIKVFERGLLEMSTRVPQKLSDLTKATYQAISSGVDPADALAFIEKSAKAATAGLATAFEAADLFTSILNAYGMQVTEVGSVSDKIFRTIVRGKTTFQELARELGAVAPVANAAGVSFEELLASIATLTISGVRANEAVTAIRNMIQKITAPPKIAEKAMVSLNKVLAESGTQLEMSAAELRKIGLVELLDKLYVATNGDIKVMRKLFEEITGLNAVLLLSGEGFENLKDILKDIQNSSGATDAAFGKMIVSFKNQMQLLKNDVGYVFARIFLANEGVLQGFVGKARTWLKQNREDIIAWSKQAASAFAGLIRLIVDMGPSIKAFIAVLAALWATEKMFAFYEAMTKMRGLATTLGLVTVAAEGTTGALTGLGLALGSIVTGIGLVAAAFAGYFFVSMKKAQKESDEFIKKLDVSYTRMKRNLEVQTGVRMEEIDAGREALKQGTAVERTRFLGDSKFHEITDVGILGSQYKADLISKEEMDATIALNSQRVDALRQSAEAKAMTLGVTLAELDDLEKQLSKEEAAHRRAVEDADATIKAYGVYAGNLGENVKKQREDSAAALDGVAKDLETLRSARDEADKAFAGQRAVTNLADFLKEKTRQSGAGPDLSDSDGKGRKKKTKDLWAELLEYLKKMRDAMANEYQKILDEQSDFNTKFAKLMDELQRKFPDDYARIAAYFADQYVEVSKKFADNAEAERKKLLQDSGFSKAMEARSTFTDRAIEKTNKFTMESRRLREELERLETLPKFQIVDEKTRLDLESTLATIRQIIAAYEEMGNLTPVQQQALSGLYGVKYGIESRLSGSQVPLTTDEQIARGVKMRELGLDELKTQLRGQFEEAAKYIPEAFRGAFGDMATEFSDVFVDAAAKGKSAMGAAFEAAGKIAATSLKDAILDIVYSVYDQTRAFYQEVVGSGLFMPDGAPKPERQNWADYETVGGKRAEQMSEWERNRAIEDGGLVKNRRERVKALDKGGVANEFVQGVVDKFKNYYANAASNLRGLGQRLPGVLRGLANQMRRQGAQYLRELVNNLPRIMRAAVPAVAQFSANLLQRAMVSLPAMIVYIADMFIVALIRSVPALIRGIPDMVMLLIEALIDQIPLITQELVMMIPDIALAIVEAILRLLTVMPGKLVDSWSEAFTDMLTNQKAWDKFWREATRGIRGMLGDMGDWFERSIFSGVRKAFRRILNWLKGELEDLNPFKKKGGGSGFGVGLGFGAIGVDDDGVDLGIGGHGVRVGGSSGISFYKSGGGIGVGSAANGRMWGSGLDGKSQVNGFLHRLLSFIPQMFGEDYLGAFSHGEITLPTDLTRAIASGSFADQISRAISAAIPTVSAPALAHATGGLGGASIINVNAKNMFARDLARVVDDARFDASKRAGWRTSKNVNAGYKG